MAAMTMTPEMSALKTRLKTTWESGDYGVFAKYLEPGALEFFERQNIPAGTLLLDIACGAGQLTIPAARKGIRVTGIDLAANLVRQARDRAAAEGLEVRLDEGDAESLPYRDACRRRPSFRHRCSGATKRPAVSGSARRSAI